MRTQGRRVARWVLAAAILVVGSARAAEPLNLVVHEWGTFTTRHDPAGEPLEWQPLTVVSDLPRFVPTASSRVTQKNTYPGTVRMETPVLYFYGDRRGAVSVGVDFPSGLITEWYPRVKKTATGIRWPRVTILPGATGRLLRDAAPSHYYPARETDSALVRCTTNGRTQQEKFLFYRGVGTFDVPVRIRLEGDLVHVTTVGSDTLGRAALVEQRDGTLGVRMVDLAGGAVSVPHPEASVDARAVLEQELHALLVAQGLYAREATAMIETWRDTWSEPGIRVLYLVPSRITEAVLPLTIAPRPSSIVRVLIGRAEVGPLTP